MRQPYLFKINTLISIFASAEQPCTAHVIRSRAVYLQRLTDLWLCEPFRQHLPDPATSLITQHRTHGQTLIPTMGESFHWDYPGLNWSHFHSLANLLSLRNGGQAEPSSLSNTLFEEDWEPDNNEDGDAPSIDTRFAHKISDSGHGRLKRRFPDCLAEFAANKKGGTAVACSAMKEAEDNVIIWIARNEGFSDVDKLAFDRLEKVDRRACGWISACSPGSELHTSISKTLFSRFQASDKSQSSWSLALLRLRTRLNARST